jgi:hypothetical protein
MPVRRASHAAPARKNDTPASLLPPTPGLENMGMRLQGILMRWQKTYPLMRMKNIIGEPAAAGAMSTTRLRHEASSGGEVVAPEPQAGTTRSATPGSG